MIVYKSLSNNKVIECDDISSASFGVVRGTKPSCSIIFRCSIPTISVPGRC